LSDLKPGEPFDFEYPLEGQRNFVLKLGAPAHGGIGDDGDIVAFSYACTHMGCPLIGLYKDEHKILGPCGCHYSTFDLTRSGMVVLGQATENLPQITLALDGDDVYASGVMGLIYGYRDNLADGKPVEVTA
jgi:arsenite oxidase small subunit